MPTYTMTGPDGKDYSIDGPPGATQAQVAAQMQQHFGAASPSQQQQQVAQPQSFEGGALDAASNGIANGLTFGLAPKIAAVIGSGLSHITPGPDVTYQQQLAQDQARQQSQSQAHPLASLIGEGVGAVTPGGLLQKGLVAGAALTIPQLTAKIGATLAPELSEVGRQITAAAKIRNTLRLSALGAAGGAPYGAVSGGIQTGTPGGAATGGAEGALTGALAGPLAGGLTAAGKATVDYFSPSFQKGAAVLAKTLKMPISDISAAYQNFYNKTGEPISMAEAMQLHSAGDLKGLAQDYSGIGSQIEARRAQVAADLPTKQSGDIATTLGQPQQPGPLETLRDNTMTAAMNPIRNTPIDLNDDDWEFLRDPQVRPLVTNVKAAPGEAPKTGDKIEAHLQANDDQNELYNAATTPDVTPNVLRTLSKKAAFSQAVADRMPLELDDIDNMRKQLANQRDNLISGTGIAKNRQAAEAWGERADRVGMMGSDQVPAYGQALQQYAADQRFITGHAHGMTGQPLDAATGADRIAMESPEGAHGYQAGLRTQLFNLANKSVSSAVKTSNMLSENAAPAQNVEATFPGRAPLPGATNLFTQGQDLTARAGARSSALNNLEQLSPGQIQKSQPDSDLNKATHALGAVALGPANPWAYYHFVKAIPGLRLSDAVQHQVGKMLADPEQAQAALGLIAKAGASQNQIRRLMQVSAASAGRAASGVLQGVQQ